MGFKVNREHTVEFVECAECGVSFGMTADFVSRRRADSKDFYCPSGHANVYRDGLNDKIRRERDLLKQRLAQRDDEIAAEQRSREAAERQAAARKGQITKLRKRAAAGVCPCCNRSFENLRQHMAGQHPRFKAEQVA